ncbi:hypothetical protein [Catenibacterium mitsuokai]|uniref:hypothetical protein n=1 Tax=Catenibacterium mitsuokai TaxID=100886 RepID=UPI00291E447B|nr:hypothetical protein AUSP0056_00037 [uncultured phage]
MCIIAIKPSHHKMIDESIIETMFQNNPDGSGYMYAYNNKVHIEKGFMTLKELLNSLDSLKKKVNIEEIPLILHFRISTSGKVDGATCHPFPVTSDLNALRKTHVITNLGMAHNGVIYDFEEKESIYSDTQLFVNKCVSYLYNLNHKFLHDDRTEKMLEPIINGSRLAFLDSHGNIYRYGEWCESDGIYYSNEGYIPWTSNYYHYDSNYYDNYYYGDDYYYYGDDEQELRILEKLEAYEEITDYNDICFIRTMYDIVEESNGVELYDVIGMFIKVDPTASRAIRIEGVD